ncbi:MAG: phosphatase PAP2 family protein [Gammaproteobacteria bacterium]
MHYPHVAQPKISFVQVRGRIVALALAAGLLATSQAVLAQQAGSAPRPAAAAAPTATSPGMAPTPGPKFTGYLAPGSLDIVKVLPPAPVEGDTRYETDRLVFKQTRAWEGSERWAMASNDAAAGPADMLRHFSCSVGVEMNPANAPKIMEVAQRATRDSGREMGIAKDHFQRKRPFWIDPGNICRPRSELGDTYDYPSGHTTAGWTWALVLAQVAPDRASQILARGRSIGESRVVCGVHNASAVEGGRYTADAVMALTSANAEFRADVEAARAELETLRKSGANPEPARCEREAALVALPITGKERAVH